MIKRLGLIALILLHTGFLFAQKNRISANAQDGNGNNSNPNDTATFKDLYTTTAPIFKPSRDFVMLQFAYNNWLTKPDSVKTKTFGYSFNSYLCYDFPIKHSNLSFAAGLGVNINVTYLANQRINSTDTSAAGSTAQFLQDTGNYKRYKFVTAYLTAPFELRYFANKMNRNKGFKAAIGLQVGTLLGAHTKGLTSADGTNVKEKIDTKRFVSPWNFAATARIGWGNFSLYGSYNLTTVFKENAGPVITPISVGICVTGL